MQRITRFGTLSSETDAASTAAGWSLSLFRDLRRSWRLYGTVVTLHELDDRALADIGLRRDRIEAAVRERLRYR